MLDTETKDGEEKEGGGDGHCDIEADGERGDAGVERDSGYALTPGDGGIPLLSCLYL
jgi:hypothetical protein